MTINIYSLTVPVHVDMQRLGSSRAGGHRCRGYKGEEENFAGIPGGSRGKPVDVSAALGVLMTIGIVDAGAGGGSPSTLRIDVVVWRLAVVVYAIVSSLYINSSSEYARLAGHKA